MEALPLGGGQYGGILSRTDDAGRDENEKVGARIAGRTGLEQTAKAGELAKARDFVLGKFLSDFSEEELASFSEKAYGGNKFDSDAVALGILKICFCAFKLYFQRFDLVFFLDYSLTKFLGANADHRLDGRDL